MNLQLFLSVPLLHKRMEWGVTTFGMLFVGACSVFQQVYLRWNKSSEELSYKSSYVGLKAVLYRCLL